jgi:hypothetical protein
LLKDAAAFKQLKSAAEAVNWIKQSANLLSARSGYS